MKVFQPCSPGRFTLVSPARQYRAELRLRPRSCGRAERVAWQQAHAGRSGWYATWGKRLIDVLVAGPGLAILAIPLLLCALLVRMSSPGSAFYGQSRVGKLGRAFRMWKLRTMRVDAEADGCARFAEAGDERITPLGRILRALRIDEIPQLWNVLRGDMSLVGPRPERPVFTVVFRREIPGYEHRHQVRPGLTGWAQIHLGYCSTLEATRAKTRLDLEYLDRMSIGLDLSILLRTPWALLHFLRENRHVARVSSAADVSISQ